MPAVRAADLVVIAASGVVATALVVDQGAGWAEWLFATVCLTALACVVRTVVRDQLRARSRAQQVRQLMATRPGAMAAGAVRDERARLSADIAALLEEDLAAIEVEVSARGRPVERIEVARRVHDRCQRASSELRRQLGLIRTTAEAASDEMPITVEPGRIGRGDVVLALATATLAAGESVLYSYTEGREWSVLSVVLTAIAGGAVLGRRTVPGLAAGVIGLAYLIGAVFATPVTGGFWCLISVGGVLWTIAARQESHRRDVGGAVFLVLAATTAVVVTDRVNAAALIAVMLVAVAGGLLTRVLRARTARADAQVRDRAAELARATDAAVAAEREQFAREIHDVVSHAVGVIAVQAAAAEVTWPKQPEQSDHAMATIAETARAARLEIEALGVVTAASGPPSADVAALVERIRAAGIDVELHVSDQPPAVLTAATYRIVQEALTNVLRHGGGASAEVRIERAGSHLRIEVSDDGPGVDQQRAERGFGLIGLAERVAYAGGTLTTGPGDGGRGFRVVAVLPLKGARVA